MAAASWFQILAVVALIAAGTRVLGPYLTNVYDGSSSRADKVFGPVGRVIYRICGIDEKREQRWSVYALSLLAFSLVSVLFLFLIQRVQGSLPFDPDGVGAVPVPLAWNTAVSFVTNTNWQNYAGENTMSHFTQMAGLAVQNVVGQLRDLERVPRRQVTYRGQHFEEMDLEAILVRAPEVLLVDELAHTNVLEGAHPRFGHQRRRPPDGVVRPARDQLRHRRRRRPADPAAGPPAVRKPLLPTAPRWLDHHAPGRAAGDAGSDPGP